MTVWTIWGQMCWKSNSFQIHKTIWYGCSHFSPSTDLLLCTFYLATCALPPSRVHLTDRQSGWQLRVTVPHGSVPHHFHYIVILNYQQRWTGKDEWHIPTSRAATALAPACPGKPRFRPCQTGAGCPSVWPRGCTNTAWIWGESPAPKLAENNVLKWKAIHLGRCAHCMIVCNWGEKSPKKAAKQIW